MRILRIIISLILVWPYSVYAADDLFSGIKAMGDTALSALRNSPAGTFKTQVVTAGGSTLGSIRNSPLGAPLGVVKSALTLNPAGVMQNSMNLRRQTGGYYAAGLNVLRNSPIGSVNSYLRDTGTGLALWAGDTSAGVHCWGGDSVVSGINYFSVARQTVLNDPMSAVKLPSQTIAALSSWTEDSKDRLCVWANDSYVRVGEWARDPVFEQDFVERIMAQNNIPLSEKPAAMNALHKMGMFRAEERLGSEFLGKLLKDKMQTTADDRPLAVVVFPSVDHNGVFNKQSDIFSSLVRNGFRVDYTQAGSDVEVIDALKKAQNISNDHKTIIILGGHGNPKGIQFGDSGEPRDTLDISDGAKIRKLSGGNSLRNTTIVLNSCSAGAGENKSANIVNVLSSALPQAEHIVGPTDNFERYTVYFTQGGETLDVEYRFAYSRNPVTGRLIYKDVPAYDAQVPPGDDKALFSSRYYTRLP